MEDLGIRMWHEECVILKDDRVIVKLKNYDGGFKGSVIVPTSYYPLNDKYRIFTYKNTEQLTDENVLKIFDNVKYHIGRCYANAAELCDLLVKAGYNAKTYVGWLFTAITEYPVYHCWVVLNDNIVLDLSDDFTAMLMGSNAENFANKSKDEEREVIASFQAAASKVPNSIRCSPVGTPTPFLFYVGSECSADEGLRIYRNLTKKYPDHESVSNVGSDGYNATHRFLKNAGVMN